MQRLYVGTKLSLLVSRLALLVALASITLTMPVEFLSSAFPQSTGHQIISPHYPVPVQYQRYSSNWSTICRRCIAPSQQSSPFFSNHILATKLDAAINSPPNCSKTRKANTTCVVESYKYSLNVSGQTH